MTIDLSNLPPKQRASMEANPELLKSLEQEIPKQVAGMKRRREKRMKSKAKWQREAEEAEEKTEELTRRYSPELMRIQEDFARRGAVQIGSKLMCPKCGDTDHGNRMNGAPWCMKCNCPLIPKSKVEKWTKSLKIKVVSKSKDPTFTEGQP